MALTVFIRRSHQFGVCLYFSVILDLCFRTKSDGADETLIIAWDNYVIKDWGKGTCSEGVRVDNYSVCLEVFKMYKSKCRTRDDGPQYETWQGQPGCHMQNAGFAEFQYNSNLQEASTPEHAPVCRVAHTQTLKCYNEFPVAVAPVVTWSRYIVKDWGKGKCSRGTRVDDFTACKEAFESYRSVCLTRDKGPEYAMWEGQPGCHMQNVGVADFHFNSNLHEATTPQHAPLCEVEDTQDVKCYEELAAISAPTPPSQPSHRRHHRGPRIAWGSFVIQDWGHGRCSEGTRVDDYHACVSAFNDYKASCDTRDDGPQYETWRGQPGCHMQNAGFAEFQYNSNLAELSTPGHAPVCKVDQRQPLQCYRERPMLHRVIRFLFFAALLAIPCIIGWSVYACYRCKCCCWQQSGIAQSRTIQYSHVVMGQAVTVVGQEATDSKQVH